MKSWPKKKNREQFEITEFINAYQRLPTGRSFSIEETEREKPDFIVRDINTKERFGIELTSVYLDDRSVPDNHMADVEQKEIPYCEKTIDQYKKCIIKAVIEKINKAKKGYDKSLPLILSIYINEYISIYFHKEDLESLVKEHEEIFDSMAPFCEIIFWPLPNNDVFSVKPS